MAQKIVRVRDMFDNFTSRDDVEVSDLRWPKVEKISRQHGNVGRIEKICHRFPEIFDAQVIGENGGPIGRKASAQ